MSAAGASGSVGDDRARAGSANSAQHSQCVECSAAGWGRLDGTLAAGSGRVLTVAKITAGGAAGYAELSGRPLPAGGAGRLLPQGRGAGRSTRTLGCRRRPWSAASHSRPLAASSCVTLMAVRRPDTGVPLARVGGTVRRSRRWTRRSPPRSQSAPSGRSPTRAAGRIERAHEHGDRPGARLRDPAGGDDPRARRSARP